MSKRRVIFEDGSVSTVIVNHQDKIGSTYYINFLPHFGKRIKTANLEHN